MLTKWAYTSRKIIQDQLKLTKLGGSWPVTYILFIHCYRCPTKICVVFVCDCMQGMPSAPDMAHAQNKTYQISKSFVSLTISCSNLLNTFLPVSFSFIVAAYYVWWWFKIWKCVSVSRSVYLFGVRSFRSYVNKYFQINILFKSWYLLSLIRNKNAVAWVL